MRVRLNAGWQWPRAGEYRAPKEGRMIWRQIEAENDVSKAGGKTTLLRAWAARRARKTGESLARVEIATRA